MVLIYSLIRFSTSHKHAQSRLLGFRKNVIRKVPPKPSQLSPDGDSSEPDRPFTLPPGVFRPKQSLGQNFLADQNFVNKICNAFEDGSAGGERVVEIGPGAGALTRVLCPRFPQMTAIEIDQRAVKFLGTKFPHLNVVHTDVLKVDWAELAAKKGGKLNVIGNLPYHIVSQVLFSFADSHKAINKTVLTMQLEVADRLIALPCTKDYGIPSVVFQLYARPEKNFHIPPTVFYPKPDVDSALVTLDFTKPHSLLHTIDLVKLRKILSTAFQQRRKMLRQSLKNFLAEEGVELPEKWATRRPEELKPHQYLELVKDLFGEINNPKKAAAAAGMSLTSQTQPDVATDSTPTAVTATVKLSAKARATLLAAENDSIDKEEDEEDDDETAAAPGRLSASGRRQNRLTTILQARQARLKAASPSPSAVTERSSSKAKPAKAKMTTKKAADSDSATVSTQLRVPKDTFISDRVWRSS